MQENFVHRLEALCPAIKARWESLLHETPATPVPASTIVRPEMLVFMVDETLARLVVRQKKPQATDRRQRDLQPFGVMRAGCQCGLHLLLTYYLAGARALRESLPAEFGPIRVEVLHDYNRLAHDDMSALCGICRYRGGTLCHLEADPLKPPLAAASPARLSGIARSPAGTPG